jgi:hypothetical protein
VVVVITICRSLWFLLSASFSAVPVWFPMYALRRSVRLAWLDCITGNRVSEINRITKRRSPGAIRTRI